MDTTGWTGPELQCADRIAHGGIADLDGGLIRADVLRNLILASQSGQDVGAIRLRRAVVDGILDLEGVAIDRPLILTACVLQGHAQRGAIILRDARFRRLGLQNCELDGPIVADRAQIDNGIFIGGGRISGALKLRGSRIGGALAVEGPRVGDGTEAIAANGIHVAGPVLLRNARCDGTIALARSELSAGLYGEQISCSGASALSIDADGSRIAGDVHLDSASLMGGLCLSHAQISGRFAAREAKFQGSGLMMDGASVTQGLLIDGAQIDGAISLDGADIGSTVSGVKLRVEGDETAISARIGRFAGDVNLAGARLVGEVRLLGAVIDGQLQLKDSKIYGSDVALRGDGLRARGGLFLSRAVVSGVVRCPAARFGNQFALSGATLKVETGLALLASGATFERDLLLDANFNTIGAVVLDQVDVRGTVDLRGSNLTSAAIARLRPQMRGAKAGNEALADADPVAIAFDETAISLVDARLGRLRFPAQAGARPRGIVDLSRAQVGSFEDWAAAWPTKATRVFSATGRDMDHLVLDGFTYEYLTNPSGRADGTGADPGEAVGTARLAWLDGQRAADLDDQFKPGPWVQLATRLRAQGFDDAARDIAIGQRRRARRAASEPTGARWQSRILDWFALYGFSPWRTVVWMLATVAVFAVIWSLAANYCSADGCRDETVLIMTSTDGYTSTGLGRGYPDFHPLAFSIDVFAPFVSFGFEDHWRFNMRYGPLFDVSLPSPARIIEVLGGGTPETLLMTVRVTLGSIFYALVLLEQLLGLILTSLAVTGFTGLLRARE